MGRDRCQNYGCMILVNTNGRKGVISVKKRSCFGYNIIKQYNKIIISGGLDKDLNACNDIIIYDISNNVWYKSDVTLP